MATRQEQTQYMIRRYHQLKSEGRCIACGKELMPNSGRLCEHHYYAMTASNRLGTSSNEMVAVLRQKMIDQDCKCPYTDVPLVLGLNCELDHRYPVSRFPHLALDPNNVEWVTREVNQTKRDMTPEEFISFCIRIATYTGRI